MSRIKQLSPHEAHKIAAGEVVERPANVVKELIENALDAQATNITVYIEDAGKKLIRVIDNGSGMDAEDARLCFNHHATSKISSVDDLQSLSTFGFRGEALSSIASVSIITLTTKEGTLDEGVKLNLTEGSITQETSASCNPGTDIIVENLFFNVPARKKFLRTHDTEWRQIISLFQAFCLDYLEISFKLFHDNQLILNCPATTSLTTRIAQLWDHTFANTMLPLTMEKSDIAISGAISHQHYARYDRNQMFFFVNKRWIKNQHLSRALLKGYLNVLPPARYPAAFIFIEISGQLVDINIHPRKEEVLFLHPRIVESRLQEIVKKTLENNITNKIIRQESSTSSFDFNKPAFDQSAFDEITAAPSTPKPFHTAQPKNVFDKALSLQETAIDPLLFNTQKKIMPFPFPTTHLNEIQNYASTSDQQINQELFTADQENYTIIGQLNKTYILLEQPDGLFLVDQHAAHERILYEQFKQRFHSVASTQLLFPHIITLNHDDIATLTPYLPLIEEQGISIELFGEQQLIIHALPIPIKDIAVGEFLHTVIGWINENRSMESTLLTKMLTEKIHAQMACKAAVKAGDILTVTAMTELLQNLQKTTNRFSCPHGRPTGWLITTYEIEKKFKRKI